MFHKQQKEKRLRIIIVIFLIFQLLIYYSDFNFSLENHFLKITILSIIGYCYFVFLSFKNQGTKVLLSILIIGFGFYLLFVEFIGSFSGTEKVFEKWDIDNYEITYAKEEYIFGPGSPPYLKLKKKYLLGILKKDIDAMETDLNSLEIGRTECLVKFHNKKVQFDLCSLKKIE
ncbi:hypothetical protein AWE51_05670 [Aquimarina aggregata]|uniref:Uncharacterized protein n=1 Tax=Aquimarina aggregata TaxID=1642818 RepID=A0A163ACF6_9FLAO|nr:hypothetical protein [Aquimarina aggregata]KZS40439.1 hypothetical protein AWE51_05670 [Aquimarina aggregata]